jgi:hypothetical protein
MQNSMSHTLGVAKEHYEQTTLPNGVPSYDNGDTVARMLRGVDVEMVMLMADNLKGVPAGTHRKKYAHLVTVAGTPNYGAMRINAGNVIRCALRGFPLVQP